MSTIFTKLSSPSDDPLSGATEGTVGIGSSSTSTVSASNSNSVKVKTESLTIRLSDEQRIVGAMADAAKKKTNGMIYTVKVDISNATSLGIGVKDLQDKLLTVSMLKRVNGTPGPVETAGVRLGDIIFGVNFLPVRDGSRTLLSTVKREMGRKRKTLHLQCWRCKQLCSDAVPGALFQRVDELVVQAYNMFRTKVFSDWERWNFIEILLDYMVEDLKLRTNTPAALSQSPADHQAALVSNASRSAQAQLQILDLEHNILQAKGLRTALCVRIVHTKMVAEAVIYVLRVEDVETGLQWVVHRRYRDFNALNDELCDMSHFTKDIPFPRKRLNITKNQRVVEERIVALEQYVRRVLHVLTLYATMDPLASRSLRHLQNFIGVDRYIDCVHPPSVDDQRCIELQAYRILNDFSSAACQQCIRFVSAVNLEALVEDGPNGYKPMLKHLSLALAEVEAFVLDNHMSEMLRKLSNRRPNYTPEQSRVFVRRCVRRQVEAAIFLPLRRAVFRIVYSFVAVQAQCMQRAMGLLQQAAPDYFEVDPCILQTSAMPRAIKCFRDVIQAYLPADQGQLLMHAAAAVMQLHSECSVSTKDQKAKTKQKSSARVNGQFRASGSDRGSLGAGDSGSSGTAAAVRDAISERGSIVIRGDSLGGASGMEDGVAHDGSASDGREEDNENGGEEDDCELEGHRVAISANVTSPQLGQGSKRERMISTASTSGGAVGRTFSNSAGGGVSGGKIKARQGQFAKNSGRSKATPEAKDLDLSSKEALADPVGTMFHAFETVPDAQKLTRKPTTSPKSMASGGATSSASTHHAASDRVSSGQKQLQSKDDAQVNLHSGSKSESSVRLLGKTSRRSSTGNISYTEEGLGGEDRASTNRDTTSSMFSPSASAFLPGKMSKKALSPQQGQGNDDGDADPGGEDNRSKEAYFSLEDEEDEETAAFREGMRISAAEEEARRKSVSLQEKLRALALVPPTPQHVHAPSASGEGGSPRTPTASSSLSSSFKSSSSSHMKKLFDGGDEEAAKKPAAPALPDRPLPAAPASATAVALATPSSSASSSSSSAAAKAPASSTVTVTPATYFTAEEKQHLDEVFSDREFGGGEGDEATRRSTVSSLAMSLFGSSGGGARSSSTDDRGGGADRFNESDAKMTATTAAGFYEQSPNEAAVVSADDFLPMFTFVLVQASLPQLLLVKEIMTALVDDEETFGECGYYLATLEAATQHIVTLAEQFEDFDKADQMFNGDTMLPGDGGNDELY